MTLPPIRDLLSAACSKLERHMILTHYQGCEWDNYYREKSGRPALDWPHHFKRMCEIYDELGWHVVPDGWEKQRPS